MTCIICDTTPLTPSQKVACPFCECSACIPCWKRFLTGIEDDAHCMFPECRKAFDREVLLQLFPRSFVNGKHKAHRQDVLFNREMSMMPSTSPYVKQEIDRRENLRVLVRLKEEKMDLKRKLFELERTIHVVQDGLTPPLEDKAVPFVQKCGDEDCRGFVSSRWVCGTCSKSTCSDCHRIREPGHACDPSETETVKLLRTDSRKCPQCATFIFKIDGCDQMWCTNCNTPFSWRTGRKINGTIHNPHYYEFVRRNGALQREHGDTPCGGLPTLSELHSATRHLTRLQMERVWKAHRLVAHLENEEIPRFPTDPRVDSNVDLRVKWSLKEISDNDLKRALQKREKAMQKGRDIGLVLSMVHNVLTDRLRAFVQGGEDINEALDGVLQYANDALRTIARRYESTSMIFNVSSVRLETR